MGLDCKISHLIFNMVQNMLSIISHCESHELSDNSAFYDVILYMIVMFFML